MSKQEESHNPKPNGHHQPQILPIRNPLVGPNGVAYEKVVAPEPEPEETELGVETMVDAAQRVAGVALKAGGKRLGLSTTSARLLGNWLLQAADDAENDLALVYVLSESGVAPSEIIEHVKDLRASRTTLRQIQGSETEEAQ